MIPSADLVFAAFTTPLRGLARSASRLDLERLPNHLPCRLGRLFGCRNPRPGLSSATIRLTCGRQNLIQYPVGRSGSVQ